MQQVSYTSFIAPISSSKLHQEVKAYNDVKHFETTYVVKMHQHKVLSEAQVFIHLHRNPYTPQEGA